MTWNSMQWSKEGINNLCMSQTFFAVSQTLWHFLRVTQTLTSSHKKFFEGEPNSSKFFAGEPNSSQLFAGEPNSYFRPQEVFCRWAKFFKVFCRWAKLLLQTTRSFCGWAKLFEAFCGSVKLLLQVTRSFLQVSQTLNSSHKFFASEPNSLKLFAGQRNSYFKPQEPFWRWAKLFKIFLGWAKLFEDFCEWVKLLLQATRSILKVSQTLTLSHKKFSAGEPNSYFKPKEVCAGWANLFKDFCGWVKLLIQVTRSFLQVSQILTSTSKKIFAGEPNSSKFLAGEPNSYFKLQVFCR